jgi:outer membrane protein OmpA-like peptidoglycan-associated protein
MTLRVSFVLVSLALAGCIQPMPVKEPVTTTPIRLGAGEQRVTDTVVVVTDASLSMYKESTFPDAKALTQSIVASLPAPEAKAKGDGPYQVGTVGFGGRERSGTAIAPYDPGTLDAATGELSLLGEHTPIDRVLDEAARAIAELEQPGRVAVVVLTDGRPDHEKMALDAGRRVLESPEEVCLHAIQVGSDPKGEAFMRALGQLSSCGSYRNASSLETASAVDSFTRSFMLGPTSLPAVAAAPPARRIVLRGLNFDFDSSEIRPEDRAIIDAAIEALREDSGARVRIAGHTDSTGPEEYNRGLSERRADAVREYLGGAGIDTGRLTAVGYGEGSPVASNDSRDGRAQNRRVEFEVQQ